jgi:hypothetical protein
MNKFIAMLGVGLFVAVASINGASAAAVEDVVSACDKMNDAKAGSCTLKIKGNGMEVCTSNGCGYCPADGSRTCSKAARGGTKPGRGLGGLPNGRVLAPRTYNTVSATPGTSPASGWRSGGRISPLQNTPSTAQPRMPYRSGGLVSGMSRIGDGRHR